MPENTIDEIFTPGGWFFTSLIILLVLVVLAVSVAALVYARKASRNLGRTTLKLSAKLAYDSSSLSEYLEISVFNHNYRDVTIKDFGLRYKDQTVSLIQEFIERKLTKSHVVVPPHESITYKMNPERVEKFVVSHNFSANSIDPIYVYAVDSVGNETLIKNISLSKIFNARQKARIALAKRQIHQEKLRDYMDTHDGSEPLTEGIYRLFHKKEIRIPELLRRTQSLMGDKTVTPENTRNNTSFNPAPVSNPSIRETSSSTLDPSSKMDTRDMKVTFLDLDIPLKTQEESESDKTGKK